MATAPSVLFVPLRSNASGLLAGAPVEAVRRKLKFASIAFDHLLIESGMLTVNAGSGGSSTFVNHNNLGAAGFQTSRQRATAQSQGFALSIGAEEQYGVRATTMTPFIQSDSAIAWSATLVPFLRELPADCDWVDTVVSRDPVGEAADTVERWGRLDQANPALCDALPVNFVRNRVIQHADRDLALGAHNAFAVMQDRLHQQVAACRFDDQSGWHGRGFAVPLLFPVVGDLPWEAVLDLRRSPHMQAFRDVLREVEMDALDEATGGDLDAAAHHVYERYLGDAVGHLDRVGGLAKKTFAGFVLGGGTGIVTSGIAGPAGIAAGAALGTAVSAVGDLRAFLRARRRRGWVSVHQRLI